MGHKSRPGGWIVGACFKRCANRDIKCKDCFANSEFIPEEKEDEEKEED